MRRAKQRWYLDTLAEGFGLTMEQKEEASSKMRMLGEASIGAMRDLLSRIGNLGSDRDGQMKLSMIMDSLVSTSEWIGSDGYAPWNLCDLEEGQQELIGSKDGEGNWVWLGEDILTKDFGTDERYSIDHDPFSEHPITLSSAGAIFPLSMEQVDRIRGVRTSDTQRFHAQPADRWLLDEVKFLTAPQLRTLLLLENDSAMKLRKELGMPPTLNANRPGLR